MTKSSVWHLWQIIAPHILFNIITYNRLAARIGTLSTASNYNRVVLTICYGKEHSNFFSYETRFFFVETRITSLGDSVLLWQNIAVFRDYEIRLRDGVKVIFYLKTNISKKIEFCIIDFRNLVSECIVNPERWFVWHASVKRKKDIFDKSEIDLDPRDCSFVHPFI